MYQLHPQEAVHFFRTLRLKHLFLLAFLKHFLAGALSTHAADSIDELVTQFAPMLPQLIVPV